jgi:hypothetical protein
MNKKQKQTIDNAANKEGTKNKGTRVNSTQMTNDNGDDGILEGGPGTKRSAKKTKRTTRGSETKKKTKKLTTNEVGTKKTTTTNDGGGNATITTNEGGKVIDDHVDEVNAAVVVVGIQCKENRYIGTARSCCARLSEDGASGMNHDRSREVGWIECAGWKCEE